MANDTMLAAETLAGEGIDCEVIDPRTLQPFDIDTVIESVRRTNRAVVVHEAVRFGGLGAEIAAQIQEEAFDYLDAPVGRVGAPVLAGAVLPGAREALGAGCRSVSPRPSVSRSPGRC